jgi:hypothetical protein
VKDKTKGKQFDFNSLYENIVLPHFEDLDQKDNRGKNSSYSVADACKTGFAVYSLKSSSLLDFRPKAPAEESNLRACFDISKIPSDNGLRKILDKVDSAAMREVFGRVINYLGDHEVLDDYQFLDGSLIVSIDGVHHYSSKSVKCDCCLERHHRDGTITYSHSMLSAAIVCPGKAEVFIADNEPIVKQDGSKKNDCECNAAKRLLARMKKVYRSKSIIYAMDAFYGCAPIIKLIKKSSPYWKYVINCKEDGNKHVFAQFDEADQQGRVIWRKLRRKDGTYEVGFLNNVALNASHSDIRTNVLYLNFRNKKGEITTFSWVTDIEITSANVMDIVAVGRSRWKIENEVFNTLKNQQYNFEHNFGHGTEHLATNFAYLMMLAFTIDQIRQYGSRVFRSIWKGLKTKKATWDAIRTVFKMFTAESMDDLCHKVMTIYQLRMIRV